MSRVSVCVCVCGWDIDFLISFYKIIMPLVVHDPQATTFVNCKIAQIETTGSGANCYAK